MNCISQISSETFYFNNDRIFCDKAFATDVTHRNAEPNLVRFGSAEAEDGPCEHGHILGKRAPQQRGMLSSSDEVRAVIAARAAHFARLRQPWERCGKRRIEEIGPAQAAVAYFLCVVSE